MAALSTILGPCGRARRRCVVAVRAGGVGGVPRERLPAGYKPDGLTERLVLREFGSRSACAAWLAAHPGLCWRGAW